MPRPNDSIMDNVSKINVICWNELTDKDKEMAEVSFKAAIKEQNTFRRITTITKSHGMSFMFCAGNKDFYIDLYLIENTYELMIDEQDEDFKILILHHSVENQSHVKSRIEAILSMRAFW